MQDCIIVAIDPDCKKSGICMLRTSTKQIEVKTKSFPELVGEFQFLRIVNDVPVIIVVEASWINTSNYHHASGDNRRVSASKGYDVGANHQTGKLIVEMAKSYGLEVIEKAPLKKIWKGPYKKISQIELEHFVPNLPKKTNQEVRDAVLLAWDFAGFPIRVKPRL